MTQASFRVQNEGASVQVQLGTAGRIKRSCFFYFVFGDEAIVRDSDSAMIFIPTALV